LLNEKPKEIVIICKVFVIVYVFSESEF